MNIRINKYYLIILLLFIIPITHAKNRFKDIVYEIEIQDMEIKDDIYNNIQEKLDIYKKDLLNKITKKKLNYYYKNLEETVATAIYPYGYFNPKINIKYRLSMKTEITTITITLGEPVITRSVAITFTGEGGEDKSLIKLLKILPTKEGIIFRSIDYEKTKKLITTWATNNGYIRSQFIKKVTNVSTSDKTADVLLHFDTNKRFYFGDTKINEVEISEKLIRKYLEFNKGDVFTAKKLVNSYSNLSSSQLFQYINLKPDFSDQSNIVPVDITLNIRKKIGLSTSVGYSSNRGIDTFIGLEHRILNSKGHRAKINVGYSNFLKYTKFVYEIPGAKPTTDTYSISTDIRKIKIEIGRSTSYSVGFSWSRLKVKWNRIISLNLSRESYEIFQPHEKDSIFLVVPDLVLFRKKANDNVFPTLGYKISWNINGAHKDMLSSRTYLQASCKLNYIFTLMNIRFIQRNKIGGNFFIDDITDLPPSKYFLEGGNSSIRGYDFQSDLVGRGKYVYVASIDMQIPIVWRWYFTTFYDIGNVFDNIRTPAKSSIGIGFMFKTPIGPVNLGYATALEKNAPEYRIFFSIGSEI